MNALEAYMIELRGRFARSRRTAKSGDWSIFRPNDVAICRKSSAENMDLSPSPLDFAVLLSHGARSLHHDRPCELVERFQSHLEAYQSGQYNETQLREEFLEPVLRGPRLGRLQPQGLRRGLQGGDPRGRHQDRRADQGPRLLLPRRRRQRSFFVEAKKPSVDIREAVSPAFQLRRYAWSAKLPVSILTDFEEFAVYDCRIRPQKTDKASTARIIYLTYTEYIDRWDELCGLFSPEAIRRGSLEKFVASKKIKKGTAEVDAAFLDEIESWRDVLARNLALRNPGISPRDLNFAVQRTIDRIVFLRICEDRGIEPYGTLQVAAQRPEHLPPAGRAVPAGRRPLQLRAVPLHAGARPRANRPTN